MPFVSSTISFAVPSLRWTCSEADGLVVPRPTSPFGSIHKLSLCAQAGVVNANNAVAAKITILDRCLVVVILYFSCLLLKLALDTYWSLQYGRTNRRTTTAFSSAVSAQLSTLPRLHSRSTACDSLSTLACLNSTVILLSRFLRRPPQGHPAGAELWKLTNPSAVVEVKPPGLEVTV